MNKKRNPRRWVMALCAAALCLLGALPASGQAPTTYEVTRTARSNTEFKFTMPANNVEVTVQYVDAGVKVTPAGDNPTVLYYETLAEAINDATTDGDVITLLKDHTNGVALEVKANVTLDLNGHGISEDNSADINYHIKVPEGKELTIKDSSTDGTGYIQYRTSATNYYAIWNLGTLTLEGGNFKNTYGGYATAIFNKGTFVMKGGSFDNDTEIVLGTDKKITIGAALAQPTNPIKITFYNDRPYSITSGWSTYMSDKNPADYFYTSKPETVTGLGSDGEAGFIHFVKLDESTKPTNTATAPTGQGTRTANPAEKVWVGDVLTAATTAQPQDEEGDITWQWYRVDADNNETLIEGATSKTYTVTTGDLGYKLVAKATQPKDAAATGFPAADITVASVPTAVVEKKDNFGDLTDANIETETTDGVKYVDYIGVKIGSAQNGAEFIVVPSDVEPTEDSKYWDQATPATGADLTINEFVTLDSDGNAKKENMLPGSEYKLYYRLVETEDTKHGTTSTDNGKPQNEKNVAIKTKSFDRKVTIDGVTYLIEDDTDDVLTPATAKIIGLPSEEDTDHSGHKKAHVYPTIEKNKIDSHIQDVFNVIGYTLTDETQVNDVDWDMNISSVGSTADSYGYLIVDQEDLYDNLRANGTPVQTQSSPEGYQIYNWNSGEAYFVLGKTVDGGKVVYEQATKNKGLDDQLTAALNDVYTGGVVKFYDLNDEELPQGTGANKDKPVAAPGQTVKAVIQLPEGFTFKSGADVIKVGDTEVTLTEGTDPYAGKYVGTFTMPSNTTTPVTFKETEFIEGEVVTYTYTEPATESATVTPDANNPATVRKYSSKLVYTIEPKHHGTDYYALTSLGLTEGVTATIVDAADGTTPVTLPTEKKVKVTLNIPAGFQGNAMTFAPVVSVCAKDIAIKANATITYFDTDGLKLPVANDALTFLTVSAISGSTVTLTEIADKQIPANTPFFITNTSDATSVRMEIDNELAAINFVDSRFKGTAIAGTMTFAEGMKYYGFDGKNFVWLKEGGSVEAHRCWLELSGAAAGAPSLNILWPDGNVTGINLIPTLSDGEGDWYDLNGRKLQGRPTKKGVYILNGQKVVIK